MPFHAPQPMMVDMLPIVRARAQALGLLKRLRPKSISHCETD